jgi:hypothetical protein
MREGRDEEGGEREDISKITEQFKADGADIVAVLNADMIAYRSPNENPQLAFTSRSSTLTLNAVLTNVCSYFFFFFFLWRF